MKQITRKVGKRSVAFLIVAGSIFTVGAPDIHAAKVNENVQVSDGVKYLDIRHSDTKTHQAVRIIETNLNDPYTAVDIGLSPKLNRLEKTTTIANYHSREGYQVVGAINGSFFHAGTPMNLVSKDNRLVHAGDVFPNSVYVNKPIAFGVNKQGHGIIDEYELNLSYTCNGTKYPITSTNKERPEESIILYTSHFSSETTKTNVWGTEVVVTTESSPTLEFGSTVTGTVSSVIHYPDKNNSTIPANGFVLSENGTGNGKLKDAMVGDTIELSVDIDLKWKGSSFMLASGSMLGQNGKRASNIDTKNRNATERAPRSAIAIDKTGKKVFFVTVDGRQKDYSDGMSLTEFANYLVELGVGRALSLDGGWINDDGTSLPSKKVK